MDRSAAVIAKPEPRVADVPERARPTAPVPRVAPSSGRNAVGLVAVIRRALDERRLFVVLPFAMIAGLVVAFVTPTQPEPVALAGVGVALAGAAVLARAALTAMRVVVLSGAFWLGFSLLTIHGTLLGTTMLAYPTFGTFEARVDEVLSEGGGEQRLIVSSISRLGEGRELPVRRARLFVRGDVALAPGDLIRSRIRFYPVPGPVVPNGFDTQFHAYFDGIGAYGTTTGAVERVAAAEAGTLDRTVDAVRRGMGARIDAVLTGPAVGIARSMMIGDQSRITDETREVMAASGLAHIYSISGLHLSIVAGGTLLVLRLLMSPFSGLANYGSTKKLAALIAIGAAFAYLLLAGGSSNVPAFRSTIMIALIFGAVLAGRRALTMRNVAIAALIIIVTDPASVFRPSFQLSFAAVVALVGMYETLRSDGERPSGISSRVWRIVAATALTSLIAGAATLPFSAYHFQQTAPLGILANVMSLILIGPIMGAIVGAALAMPLGLELPFLVALQWGLDALLWIAASVAALSEGLTLHPLLAPLTLVLTLAALAWFAFLPTWHRMIGPAVLVPAILLIGLDRPPDLLVSDSTQAVALRVGDELATVAGQPDSFAVNVWRDTYGEPLVPEAIACDSLACVAEATGGFRFALVKDPAGFYEECGADVVVTRRRAPSTCGAGAIIDEEDLSKGGVHWLAWNAAERTFAVRQAIPEGDRPWRPRR